MAILFCRRRITSGPGFGGHGGDVILESCDRVESFVHLDKLTHPDGAINAQNGQDAWETHRGLNGKPRIIEVSCTMRLL